MAWLEGDPELDLLRLRSARVVTSVADVSRTVAAVRGIGAGWLDRGGYGWDPGRLDGEELLAGARLLAGALTPDAQRAQVQALLDPDTIADRALIEDLSVMAPLVGLSREGRPQGPASRWEQALAGADAADALLAAAALVAWVITQPDIVPHRVDALASLYEIAGRRAAAADTVVAPARLSTLRARAAATTTPPPVAARLTDIVVEYGGGPAAAIPDAVGWEMLLAAYASTGVADLPARPSRWTARQRAAADAAKDWAVAATGGHPVGALREHLAAEDHFFPVQIRPAGAGDDVPAGEPPVTPAVDARLQVQVLDVLAAFSRADRAGAWRGMRQILRTGVGGSAPPTSTCWTRSRCALSPGCRRGGTRSPGTFARSSAPAVGACPGIWSGMR
ncbi:hypothetical protein J2S43_000970 [Catenuloplanes nepalensis]|uniref:Uncharacterized protein n=1 Tax=Catenuloplanes nepalensis TaxID=587533 RepID=A0ABT9MM16_9ACTN|nr:hypothetical protein [Catenuloplanes nepalensis]MDP9792458.1 hypothetical protein [Catenuloplanes nepalensis]